jgi:hypothetical protein
MMKPTSALHKLGQSLWLDNITRELLDSGMLQRFIEEFSVTLTPAALGRLVALYEHSVLTQGTIWQIDSFDQWGVGLGKALAHQIIPQLESASESKLEHDSSANALIRRYRKLKASA